MSGRFGSGVIGLHGALRSEAPIASSGVPWIDRKVRELAGAREFLERVGMAPQQVRGNNGNFYRADGGWKVPHWAGTFSDDQLIDFARERGFRP